MKKIILPALLLLCALHSVAQQKDLATQVYTLKRFLDKNHYQPVAWNDSSSSMLYDKWLGELDKEKLFFTRQDITSLEQYRYRLDDEILNRKTDFFNVSTKLFRARLQQADSMMQRLFEKPFNFTKPDNFSWPSKYYATSTEALALRWQQYLKWQLLDDIAGDLVSDSKKLTAVLPDDFAALEAKNRAKSKVMEQAYFSSILSTAENFFENLREQYLNAIAWCYDPHTTYMSMREKKEFDTEMSASSYSSGFTLEESEKGDKTIGFLQPGGSAWRSGQLHKGDVLVKIKKNGKTIKVEDLSEQELEAALEGNSSEDIEIIVRTVAGELKTVMLQKEKITDEESVVKSYVLHGSKNIGYINLPGFYSREESVKTDADLTYDGCANDVSKEIVKLKKDTISGLVLDLRYNGGGSMWEAMQLAGIFIDIGPVASMKDREGKTHFLKDPNRGTIYDGPLLILTNGGSASASEFVAAVLQDYNRAVILGGATYGKGTAQTVLPLDTTGAFNKSSYDEYVKVTGDKFYRVNGGTTQWTGVIPDIDLPDLYAADRFKEKNNKSALIPDRSKTGIYQPLSNLPVSALKTKSMQRTAADPYFQAIAALSDWIAKYDNGRSIPLHWSGFVDYYNANKERFKQAGDEGESSRLFTVSNNAFDRQRIDLSTTQSKEINNVYLKQISQDKTLQEAFEIMTDWSGIK